MSFLSDYNNRSPSPMQAASRFDAFFDVYGSSLKLETQPIDRVVTLITRSPASPIAQALALNLGRFETKSIEIAIILAQIAPPGALDFLLQALQKACGHGPEIVIRWAKNRALLEAHERLTLGRTLCWTGDAMRRSEDSRSAIDRVDDTNPAMIDEAHSSFAAMWKASKPLPKTAFSNKASHAYSIAEYNPTSNTGLFTDINVIRLEDYFRSRRH